MKIMQTVACIAGVSLFLTACNRVNDGDLYLYNLGDYVRAAGTWNTKKQTLNLDVNGRYTFYNGGTEFASGDYTVQGDTYTFKLDDGKDVTATKGSKGLTFSSGITIDGITIDKETFILSQN